MLNTIELDLTVAEYKYVRQLEAAATLDRLDMIKRPDNCKLALNEVYMHHLLRVLRNHLVKVRTPEEVLECHNYFKSRRAYSREIQIELGEKAREIFSNWVPDSQAFRGIVHSN